jgi:hypothetical protein
MEPLNKRNDVPREMLPDEMLRSVEQFVREMEKRSITLDQIVRVLSTIREQRLSAERQTVNANLREMARRINGWDVVG